MTRHVVIPARYGSSRFPGKPLALLQGEPMVAHVWRRAQESGIDSIWVATDDTRIAEAVQAFGGRAILTSPDHLTGTDRLAEVARSRGWEPDDIVVNLQGDEPGMPSALIARVAADLADRADAAIATLATPISAAEDVFNANVVKVVTDLTGRALYFSRAPIPWCRDTFGTPEAPETLPTGAYLRHLGLYAYRVRALTTLAEAPATSLERLESLEQLRALALGLCIHVGVERDAPPHGVDTPEDLARMQGLLEAR